MNDEALTAKMIPTLDAAAGKKNVVLMDPMTASEDFSFFQCEKPGVFIFLGGMKPGADPLKTPSHHTPDFLPGRKWLQAWRTGDELFRGRLYGDEEVIKDPSL